MGGKKPRQSIDERILEHVRFTPGQTSMKLALRIQRYVNDVERRLVLLVADNRLVCKDGRYYTGGIPIPKDIIPALGVKIIEAIKLGHNNAVAIHKHIKKPDIASIRKELIALVSNENLVRGGDTMRGYLYALVGEIPPEHPAPALFDSNDLLILNYVKQNPNQTAEAVSIHAGISIHVTRKSLKFLADHNAITIAQDGNTKKRRMIHFHNPEGEQKCMQKT